MDSRCSHGWPKVMLEHLEVKCMERLTACGEMDESHPFREEMVSGARIALETVRGHLKEIR